jgi:hypothetical protein
MLGFIGKILGGGLLGGVNTLAKTVFGDRSARDEQYSSEQTAIQQGYQAEFLAPEKKGIFNQLVDGLNRLVRPFFTFGTIALFIWAAVDPVEFSLFAQSLTLIPELLWYILMTIIAFWFGGKLLSDAPKKISNDEIKTMVSQATVIQKQREEATWEKDYQEELKDNSKPLSNKAILEWNKRNNKG